MEYIWYTIIFVFGAIIGSFLNVVIYRLHTGKSLGGRSHCLSCGTILVWYELVPLLSYSFQVARCRTCGSNIPSRYFFVELLTAVSFLLLWTQFQTELLLLVFNWVLASVLVVILVYDVRHTIIPDELVVTLIVLALLSLLHQFAFSRDIGDVLLSLLGGAVASIFFGGLWYMSKGRWMGLGDAKLALPLGFLTGLTASFSMIIFGFWVGAVISLGILGFQKVRLFCSKRGVAKYRRYLTIKSEVPFAPFLIAGFVLAYYVHADIFDVTFFLFSF